LLASLQLVRELRGFFSTLKLLQTRITRNTYIYFINKNNNRCYRDARECSLRAANEKQGHGMDVFGIKSASLAPYCATQCGHILCGWCLCDACPQARGMAALVPIPPPQSDAPFACPVCRSETIHFPLINGKNGKVPNP
jgi:hypothetical protein